MSVTLPDGTAITYIHDPNGRRIAKKINGGIVEKYLWSGLTTLLAVYDGSDNLLQRFEYADGRMPFAMTAGGSTYYLAYDQVGSLRLVTDSSGAIIKRIDYDTFGNILSDSNPGFTVPFGFAGGLHDRDTGLVRFGFRDYMPEIGRWTAKDPILFAGGDANLYGYVGNDPVNLVDPDGLSPQDRVNWAINQLNNNSVAWAMEKRLFRSDYWKCNEFVYHAHVDGDPDAVGFPTVLRNNQKYWKPTVSDYANKAFVKARLDYLSIADIQPGDIVVWYDANQGDHHSAIAINKSEVVYAGKHGVKKNSISNMFRGTTPVVRRFKY